MIERLSAMSGRAKAMTAVALIVLTPLAVWAGYNVGYVLGHN